MSIRNDVTRRDALKLAGGTAAGFSMPWTIG